MKKWLKAFTTLGFGLLLLSACSSNASDSKKENDQAKTAQKDSNGTVYLYVTRHGKTMFNTASRAQGWSDTPLTKPGVEVAKELGKGLKQEKITFDSLYSSDLGRARETAKLVAQGTGQAKLPLHEDQRLREVCYGIYEGDLDENMWGDAAKKLGYKDMNDLLSNYDKVGLEKCVNTIAANDSTKQAENFVTVKNRMQRALKDIAEKQAKKGGGNVLVVGHGMSILAMLSDMTDKPKPTKLENASVTKIKYQNGKFTVQTMGDTSYLEKGSK